MRIAISYVSTAEPNLLQRDVMDLFTTATEFNIKKNITGLLLYANGNFFQLIIGEENDIKKLYSKIKEDRRHFNIIKLIEKPVLSTTESKYFCADIAKIEDKETKIKKYLPYIEVLDHQSRRAVEQVIEAIIINENYSL